MEKNLPKNVMDKIKKEHIKPTPKWGLMLKQSFLWGLLAVSLLFGGISTAIVIFMLRTNDFALHERFDSDYVEFMLEGLPYFWMVILLLFVGIALYNFKHAGRGYRYRLPTILGVVFSVSAVLGIGFYGTGLAQAVDNELLQKFPAYQKMTHDRVVERWSHPERGLLAGEVLGMSEGGELMLVDFDGKEWLVIVQQVPRPQMEHLRVGVRVKTFGEAIDEDEFMAFEIHMWRRNYVKRPRRGPRGPRRPL